MFWTATPRYTVGAALIALGYSANSEDPAELEAAVDRLIELKPHALWLEDDPSIAPYMKMRPFGSGRAGLMITGWLLKRMQRFRTYFRKKALSCGGIAL